MELLVSPQWLAERIGNTNLVILDATLPPVGVNPAPDTHASYLAEHLPGAIFFDIEKFSDSTSGLPHTLPSAQDFGRDAGALGIGDTMTIVVYEQAGVFSAPRALWMLRSMGAADVHLLDGGLAAWKAAGFQTESGEVQRPAATFRGKLAAGALTTFDEMQRTIADRGQILDARSTGRFSGSAPEPRPGLSSGHMPGATSVPFTDLLSEGCLRSPDELKSIFAGKNVHLEEPITTSCGSGVTAAVISLALELAGAKYLSLYDGSWAEYAQRPEAVIEKEA